MIQSMTGFGRGAAGPASAKLTTLIKAVNGRFLDIKIRGLELDPADEKIIRDILSDRLVRGTIRISLDRSIDESAKSLTFNKVRFDAIESILLDIQKEYGRHLEMSDFIKTGDLFIDKDVSGFSSEDMIQAVELACKEVDSMRRIEGKKLQDDLKMRLILLKKSLSELEKDLPVESVKREERYRMRIQELLAPVNVDESRILQEAAMMSERSNVTEETVRLCSHFQQFRTLLAQTEPVGRKLNFLLQEMVREINTIGSKCSSERIVSHVICMKDEAEKMREQVQNIL